jgi:hypothetical protein
VAVCPPCDEELPGEFPFCPFCARPDRGRDGACAGGPRSTNDAESQPGGPARDPRQRGSSRGVRRHPFRVGQFGLPLSWVHARLTRKPPPSRYLLRRGSARGGMGIPTERGFGFLRRVNPSSGRGCTRSKHACREPRGSKVELRRPKGMSGAERDDPPHGKSGGASRSPAAASDGSA